ncbi:MAG: hypothetical protein JSV27_07815 [Candidatus Bathyarchaeota archaeon]|nr:MAG: hypothetical protein JSV27_07815 [Candidatus Bathyarchaeota archaeon]
MSDSSGVFRSLIGGFVDELVQREVEPSVGLFGSWTRYGASTSSALDLLVASRSGADHEFYEWAEYDGLLLNVNRIPWFWIGEVVAPEVDHRLHESVVLHDPEGVLGRARGFVEDNYRTSGRVEVRTEGYLKTSDTYMSRVASAMNRGDLETALVFAELSLVSATHVLLDVAGLPVTRGSYVWDVRRACERLGLMEAYFEALGVFRLAEVDSDYVSSLRGSYEAAWRGIREFMVDRREVIEDLHERLRRDVVYLTDPLALGLVMGRTEEMLGEGDLVGAAMYLRGWLLPLLEVCAWVVQAGRGDKFDYTSLFRTLGEGEIGGVYDESVTVFGLDGVGGGDAEEAVAGCRAVVSGIRGDRRRLIRGFVD